MKSKLLQILALVLVVLLNCSCTNEEQDIEWSEHLNKGTSAIRAQDWEEAEKNLNQSLKEAEKFGTEDRRVATSLVNLALCYAKKNDYEQAIKVSRRALKIDEKEFGDSHAVAYDLNQLGAYLDYAGRHKEATSFFLQAKAMSKKLLKKVPLNKKKVHRIDLGTTLGNLAQNMVFLKKYDESKSYIDQMLDILRKINNPKHYFEELNRALKLLEDNKDDKAIESLFAREYKALESKYGADSQWVRVLNSRHGKYYIDRKDYKRGEEFYRKILAFRKEKKQKNIFVAEAANALALCLSEQNKYREALPYFEEVLTLMDGASEKQLAAVKTNYEKCKAAVEGKK